jgi:hypothetical protein
MEQKLSDSIKETIQGVSEKSTQLEKVHLNQMRAKFAKTFSGKRMYFNVPW